MLGGLELGEGRSEALVDPPHDRSQVRGHVVEGSHHEPVAVPQQRTVEANVSTRRLGHGQSRLGPRELRDGVLGLADQDQRRDPSAHGRNDVPGGMEMVSHLNLAGLAGGERGHRERVGRAREPLDHDVGVGRERHAVPRPPRSREDQPGISGEGGHGLVQRSSGGMAGDPGHAQASASARYARSARARSAPRRASAYCSRSRSLTSRRISEGRATMARPSTPFAGCRLTRQRARSTAPRPDRGGSSSLAAGPRRASDVDNGAGATAGFSCTAAGCGADGAATSVWPFRKRD